MMTLLAGATLYMVNLFDAGSSAPLIDSKGITHVLAPDNIIHSLLELHVKAPSSKTHYTYPSLKFIGYANFTSSLGSSIIELVKLLPGLHLSGLYGSSECLALMSAWVPSDSLELRTSGGGRLNPGLRVRVVDSDGSIVEGFGVEKKGELEFSGYSILKRYIGNEEAMKKNAYVVDGTTWFRSGDLGHLVEPLAGSKSPTKTDFAKGLATDSFVYLARLGDSSRLRGFLVDPTEIEATLVKHEMVGEVQVVGVNLGGGKGEDAVAFVIPESKFKGTEMDIEKSVLAFAKPLLANYKVRFFWDFDGVGFKV
jgi:fatty-acyl-CoA synthase